MSRTCKGCGQPIWFIQMQTGGSMPVNEQPVAYIPGGGNRVYITEDGTYVHGRDWTRKDGTPREFGYISHFSTCPKAEEFRRNKRARAKSEA